jgi:hypothetical protein
VTKNDLCVCLFRRERMGVDSGWPHFPGKSGGNGGHWQATVLSGREK